MGEQTGQRVARRRGMGWLAGAAAAAVFPKCAGCLLAYAGLLAGVNREICGVPDPMTGGRAWLIAAIAAGTWLAFMAVLHRRARRKLG